MSFRHRDQAPATILATAAISLIALFGSTSCSASGTSSGPTSTNVASTTPNKTSTPNPNEQSETKIHISSYTDSEGLEYGDKSFVITKNGVDTTGDLFCVDLGLQTNLDKLNGEVVEDMPNVSSATIILKDDPACEDNYLTENEAASVLGSFADGL